MEGQAVTGRNTAGPPQVQPPGFVGRERDLAALSSALAGAPAVVLIEGEAGIGKSRLIAEFLASPGGQARRALVARCPPFRQPHTLGPVTDAIRQAAGQG
jgi:predicted ATPase